MAFGLSTDPFLLKEGLVQVGTWTTPENIGNGTVGDPASLFTGEDLGYFRQGSTNVGINRSYAEARGFTPSIKLRKDLIQKNFMITVELFQYNSDLLELARGLYVQAGYTAAGFTGDLGWLGHDEPVQPFYGYLIQSELTDGTPLNIAMWYGKVTTEDVSIALSGTDYATTKMQIEAFNHPNFGVTGTDAQKTYGMIYTETV